MTFKKALRLSIIMHIMFFLLAGGIHGCGKGQGKGKGNGDGTEETDKGGAGDSDGKKIEDISKPEVTEVILIERKTPMPSMEQLQKQEHERKLAQCKDSFGGIGVTHDPMTGTITTAHKFYPAWEAGIRDGDRLVNPERLRGKIGTSVTVTLIRNGETLTFNLIRGKICVQDVTP